MKNVKRCYGSDVVAQTIGSHILKIYLTEPFNPRAAMWMQITYTSKVASDFN